MSEREPLWSDKDMRHRFVTAFERSPNVHEWALLCELRDDYQARLRAVEQERDTAQRVIAYLDSHAPVADSTCDEPGITLSEAARRALADEDGWDALSDEALANTEQEANDAK